MRHRYRLRSRVEQICLRLVRFQSTACSGTRCDAWSVSELEVCVCAALLCSHMIFHAQNLAHCDGLSLVSQRESSERGELLEALARDALVDGDAHVCECASLEEARLGRHGL